MSPRALFEGLISDEWDQPVTVAYIGGEPCYVVDDAGFKRHIPSQQVDRQVLDQMKSQVEGNEDLLSEQTAKMLGQEDPFSKALIEKQLKNIGGQMEMMLETGIPENARAYLGMMGFKVVINVHGEVLRVEQPSAAPDEGGEE